MSSHKSPLPGRAAPLDTPPEGLDPSTTRILFVDDEEYARRLFVRQMKDHGYVVDAVGNSAEALEQISHQEYEAVVSDLHMPGRNGIELTRMVQRLAPHLSVILVTGDRNLELPEDPWVDRALVSVMLKPWSTRELLAKLQRAVQATAKRRGALEPPRRLETLLLVEDSPADADYFRRLCRSTELEVGIHHCERLSEAAELLRDGTWDMVVTDLGLPDARGLDAVQRLREIDHNVPLVVLSGGQQQGEEAIRWGAHDFLCKDDLTANALARALRHAVERRSLEQRLLEQAHQDPLTGLGNREFFRSRIVHALARARRSGGVLGVLFLDLDRFKEVNDEWGHHAGDAVLVEVAGRLTRSVRGQDTLARLGGDEFAIILEDVADRAEAEAIADRIRRELSEPHEIVGELVHTPPSIGLSLYPDHGESDDSLLRSADEAMYRAKRAGGGCWLVHEDEALPATTTALQLMAALPVTEGLYLRYQPQLSLQTGHFQTFEALLRHRDGNGSAPTDLLERLENSCDIDELGRWVLEEACAQLRRWEDDGWPDLRIAVNISAHQLESGSLLETVESCLGRYEVAPSRLELELTEHALVHDYDSCTDQLGAIRALGVSVALDDFGTGFSSLGHLQRIPIDVLKIDRIFLERLDEPNARALATAVIRLGRRLGLQVVAEGVETAEQLDFLRSGGCHRSQGYLHARPFLPTELATFFHAAGA